MTNDAPTIVSRAWPDHSRHFRKCRSKPSISYDEARWIRSNPAKAAGTVVAIRSGLRKLIVVLLVCSVTLFAAIFGGPVLSGAVFLLLPSRAAAVNHELPQDYEPLHKAGVDLATGLYVREDEDLIVGGTPNLILRRTHLAGYRVSRQFGVGATHDGEVYLHGDLQRISLILAKGSRVTFDRTSAGRDRDGHTISYPRDDSGRVARMEAGDRWIAFEYDDRNRIERARASTGQAVTYEYDSAGRLSRVATGDDRLHWYTYTDRDEMATIVDPGIKIENTYDTNGRCVRQIVRYPGGPEALTFTFSYRLDGQAVVQTDMARSDGEWSQHTFSSNRAVLSEAWGRSGIGPAHITYERNPETDRATALTVTCPDRKGIPLRHTSIIKDGDEERVKTNLLSTHCSWRDRS